MVAHVEALGVRHQKEVHHSALVPVVESEVEGQHNRVVLADRSARKGEEQCGTPWWDPVPEANCKVCKPIEQFDENKFMMECDGERKKETSVDYGL